MKLKSKIYLYSSVLFAALLAAACVSIYLLFGKMSLDAEIRRFESEAELTAERISEAASRTAPDDLLRAYAPADGMLRVVTPDGGSLARPVTASDDPQRSERLSGEPYHYVAVHEAQRFRSGGEGYIRVSVPVIWPDGEVLSVQVSRSIADLEDRLNVLKTVLVIVALLALVPTILANTVLANRIVKPISALTETMGDIRRSGRFQRIETDKQNGDELAEMGRTFNDMIVLLESNFARQERFVSDASHELKTPLTIIESYASLLKRRGKERPEVFDEAVEAILSESVRMRELTERLLQTARSSESDTLDLQETDLARSAAESVKAFIRAYGRDIEVIAPEPVFVRTDEAKIRQLLFILLDNARKYSEATITLRVAGGSEEEARLQVVDRGIGIPEDELPKVFDRFYRVDSSRARLPGTGGAGLGLALAQDLAEALDIAIGIESRLGEGTTVTLRFRNRNGSRDKEPRGMMPSRNRRFRSEDKRSANREEPGSAGRTDEEGGKPT
ncbi:two-component sensor histidine kinase [Saccharibacillus sp. O23]|uniref:sensor histidine kinase n=1 Tax=Saccharibacillus sp. O23 TaxID=2009338 RepID=UPI000B4E5634|nr:ATP-binding protein [Saccharibacillus sp. O23]OWR30094.1 two-component sensor histidine kinase [Saccharibacillus sp. O23]